MAATTPVDAPPGTTLTAAVGVQVILSLQETLLRVSPAERESLPSIEAEIVAFVTFLAGVGGEGAMALLHADGGDLEGGGRESVLDFPHTFTSTSLACCFYFHLLAD